ncbi:unnamed protein product [Arctia plantaginis]|uniref:Uncharacterized protein n=1 Tax=Arctia plantaginis TaxID=874455 RepID=A0A8S1A609_ARCPL|nr:unnamed protein product [Arctia plantaginis]
MLELHEEFCEERFAWWSSRRESSIWHAQSCALDVQPLLVRGFGFGSAIYTPCVPNEEEISLVPITRTI